MATFSYRCGAGHVTDQAFAAGVPRTKTAKCGSCNRRAAFSFKDTHGPGNGYVIRDFPEHFSETFGCVVKSRKHHRELQRLHKVHDWEPCRNSPGSQLSLGRRD